MEPKKIVRAWVDAFNRGDADLLSRFYSEDAVNHQVAEEPVQGRENIREYSSGSSNEPRWCVLSKTSFRMATGQCSNGRTRWA